MAKKSMTDIRNKMQKLDICMMTTRSGRGILSSRPMSNNGDVEYDGNSWFFTFEGSQKVKDIEKNPQVNLAFTAKNDLFIALTGKAKLVRSKASMQEHWQEQLKQWFPDGIETEGIVMIHVFANHIAYWQNEEQGEINL